MRKLSCCARCASGSSVAARRRHHNSTLEVPPPDPPSRAADLLALEHLRPRARDFPGANASQPTDEDDQAAETQPPRGHEQPRPAAAAPMLTQPPRTLGLRLTVPMRRGLLSTERTGRPIASLSFCSHRRIPLAVRDRAVLGNAWATAAVWPACPCQPRVFHRSPSPRARVERDKCLHIGMFSDVKRGE